MLTARSGRTHRNLRLPRPWALWATTAAMAILAACGGQSPAKPPSTSAGTHQSSPQPSPSPTAVPLVSLADQAIQATCPPGSPQGAECFNITITGSSAGYGTVTSGTWFDVEAPAGAPACGRPFRYTEHIQTDRGSLTVLATGPRLCIGVVSTVYRTYTVIHATGAFGHLHGHGTITLVILSSGATETWSKPSL